MDLAKLRFRARQNIHKLQKIRNRQKCLSLNASQILQNLTTKSNLQLLKKQEYLQQKEDEDTFKTKEDQIQLQCLRTNKLYAYFLNNTTNMQNSNNFLDKDSARSKISIRQRKQKQTKMMTTIYDSAVDKYMKKQYKIEKIQTQLKNLYKQNHYLHNKLRDAGNQSPSQKIHWLREVIQSLEASLQQKKIDHENLKLQIINFLRNLVKNLFMHQQGVSQMLRQLIRFNYKIQPLDCPDYLDKTSKQFLLKMYEYLKKYTLSRIQLPYINKNSNNLSHSKFIEIVQHKRLKKVYSETKGYLRQWISKSQEKPTIVKNFQRENYRRKSQQIALEFKLLKQSQVKRLKHKYPKQKYESILKYMFGDKDPNKKQIILPALKQVRKTRYSSLTHF